jgi:predicted lactoylglutathione lyase
MASVLAGLDHIQLPVADLAASIAWYERLLGFRERFAAEGVDVVSFDDGGFALFLKFFDPDGTLLGLIQHVA